MTRHSPESRLVRFALLVGMLAMTASGSRPAAQARPPVTKQKIDQEYTA
jgi:hypothetical protein